jgi:hypothetical protein
MTRKLQELFEIAQDSSDEMGIELPENTLEITEQTLNNIEKINNALPQVRGLEAADIEIDDLANLATSSYKDLMDLGMQVDSRYSSEIFSVASNMLGHAITAKTAKMTKKLKMIELQLKQAQLEEKLSKKEKELDATPVGVGQALDRNELLKMMLQAKNEKE